MFIAELVIEIHIISKIHLRKTRIITKKHLAKNLYFVYDKYSGHTTGGKLKRFGGRVTYRKCDNNER